MGLICLDPSIPLPSWAPTYSSVETKNISGYMDITPAWGKETWEDYTRQFLPSAFYCLSGNITDFQGFVGFRRSQKWFSYSSTHTHYFQLQFLETLSSKLSIISCNTESGCVGDLVYLYMCVYTSFSHSEFTFSSHLSSSIRLSMSSKVWVYFSAVNCYIKSTSRWYRMTLAFIRPSNVRVPSFHPRCWERFLGYASLWLSLPCLLGAGLP